MIYRDPTEALRMRIAAHKEEASRRRERITEALLRRLPTALTQRLRASEQALPKRNAKKMETLRRHEKQVQEFSATIDEVYAIVPALDDKLQQIKRGFPKRRTPRGYGFPDVYDKRIERLRGQLHAKLRELDPRAKLYDAEDDYFNQHDGPLLIDAHVRVGGVPVTLASHPMLMSQQGLSGANDARFIGYEVRCYVARGLPALNMHPQSGVDALLQWVGLQSDVDTRDALFDKAFRIVPPSAAGAEELLSPGVRRSMRLLAELTAVALPTNVPRLLVIAGEAQVVWQEYARECAGLETALGLLKLLRETPPPLLLEGPGAVSK